MDKKYSGADRRKFVRLDYVNPLVYKICKKETIDRLLKGYTSNISESGILCNINDKVDEDDILWLSFDRETIEICKKLEETSLVYQGGIVGKVVRVEKKEDGRYNVGIKFITREEYNSTHIYPQIYFLDEKN
jgi:c-di-GMP-binding flagellar brake protein YcgR